MSLIAFNTIVGFAETRLVPAASSYHQLNETTVAHFVGLRSCYLL